MNRAVRRFDRGARDICVLLCRRLPLREGEHGFGNLRKRFDVGCGIECDGFFGHTEDDAALLVLSDGLGAFFAHSPQSLRTVGTHSRKDGADGVYVAGCLEGDCHYLTGNLKARKRVEYVKRLLEELGIEPERAEMYNLSAAQGPRFAEIAREFTARIQELGPTPVGAGKKAKEKAA